MRPAKTLMPLRKTDNKRQAGYALCKRLLCGLLIKMQNLPGVLLQQAFQAESGVPETGYKEGETADLIGPAAYPGSTQQHR